MQAILGTDGFGLFKRAATDVGVFGFLVAFMAGFFVYGAGLTIFTLALKWIVIGPRQGRRAQVGLFLLTCPYTLLPSYDLICYLHQERMKGS